MLSHLLRLVLLGGFTAAVLGCEAQPIGGRCESNLDCDRDLVNPKTRCVPIVTPNSICQPGGDCICCPIVLTADSPPRCRGSSNADGGTDATVTDAADVQDVTTTDVQDVITPTDAFNCNSCGAGFYCENNARCRPLKALGEVCGGAVECPGGHCVEGVCCNSACTGAGRSCRANPDFTGICTTVMTDAGSTTDASDMDVMDASGSGG